MSRVQQFEIPFEEEKAAEKKPKKKIGFWTEFYDWIDSIVWAVIAVFFVFTFLFRVSGVNGTSMLPTLNNKDWVAVSNFNFHADYGDIVVVTQPNDLHEPLIKRIIARGGDTIDINFETHEVIRNGSIIHEPYINEPTSKSYDIQFPLTVPEGFVFVMGDNRNWSIDSRSSSIGLIDERYLMGKAVFRLLPFGNWKIG